MLGLKYKTLFVAFHLLFCSISYAQTEGTVSIPLKDYLEFKNQKDICDSLYRNLSIEFQKQINKVVSDSLELSKFKIENQSLKQSELKKQNDQLLKSNDSLSIESSKKDSVINKHPNEIINAKNDGINQIKEKIRNYYQRPLDELIESSSEDILDRDLIILGNGTQFAEKITDAKSYFQAKESLSRKYDQRDIARHLSNMNKLAQTKKVKELKDILNQYSDTYVAFTDLVNDLIAWDSRIIVIDENTRNTKQEYITKVTSAFIFNYQFRYEDYPYISNLLVEIIDQKRKEIDSDLTPILDKL